MAWWFVSTLGRRACIICARSIGECRMRTWVWLACTLVVGFSNLGAAAQSDSQPRRDVAYPGVIKLAVDATDLDHRVMAVRETVPVPGGEAVTLLYPQWLPGQHGPN